ncbi:antimicrobial peptide cecropin [Anopheles darlingi]|uniref:Antimicrobial peptide cecropin n=1 Tax=Anopheles darlingi TaxID=43151 RepID=B6DDX7_ANODA|nr:cecropin-C-like [Anopheles darlingi]ETN64457.1 antimicrobial peptide cecropin [Anopheles darlingi]
MQLKVILLVALVLMAALFGGETEARRFRKFLKKVEGAGRRITNAAQKGLPVVAGVKGIIG